MGDEGAVAFIGFPRTGKSTYLGAIWQIAQDPSQSDIFEADFSGDRSHVQQLGEAVARGEEVAHTEVDSDDWMRLRLGFVGLGAIDVNIPDLSGESVRLLVEDRVLHPLLSSALASAQALAIFVHPEKVELPMTIAMAQEILARHLPAEAAQSQAVERLETDEITIPPFEAKKSCTAAKYLDALENVVQLLSDRWPVRVALIISAWDSVDQPDVITPSQWLIHNAPALHGFVTQNPDMVTAQVFAVSAQGAPVPMDAETRRALGPVSERAYSRGSTGQRLSLAAPLRWAVWGSTD